MTMEEVIAGQLVLSSALLQWLSLYRVWWDDVFGIVYSGWIRKNYTSCISSTPSLCEYRIIQNGAPEVRTLRMYICTCVRMCGQSLSITICIYNSRMSHLEVLIVNFPCVNCVCVTVL